MKSVQSAFSSARSAGNLVTPGFVDQDIPSAFPEVFPVSGKRLGTFLLDIAAFGLHDLIKRSGHISIKRRHQARFQFQAQFLYIRRIKGKIVFAERADAHQGQFSLEEIVKLRQLVYPERPQNLAPGGDAKVVFEFASFLQGVGLKDIILQVFAIGMHGAEFFDIDDLAVLAQAF